MSENAFSLSQPIPFSAYYAWLREFALNSEVREQVARFDDASRRHFEATGSGSAWDEDEEARAAIDFYRRRAFDLLERRGWPKYREMIMGPRASRNPGGRNLIAEMQSFADFGAQIIRGGFPDDFWVTALRGLQVDIEQPKSVQKLIEACLASEIFLDLTMVDLDQKGLHNGLVESLPRTSAHRPCPQRWLTGLHPSSEGE